MLCCKYIWRELESQVQDISLLMEILAHDYFPPHTLPSANYVRVTPAHSYDLHWCILQVLGHHLLF